MTLLQFFNKVYGEDVFKPPRTQDRADKRGAAYTFAWYNSNMSYSEIGYALGRNHSTVMSGRKRFIGLLESGDKIAIQLYNDLDKEREVLMSQGGKIEGIKRRQNRWRIKIK